MRTRTSSRTPGSKYIHPPVASTGTSSVMIPAFLLQMIRTVRGYLRLLHSPAALPQATHQPRQLAATYEVLAYLGLMLVVSGAYFVTVWTATRVSVCFAPVTLSMIVHVIYLFIYALERKKVIRREFCDSLIQSVENLCPVAGNIFVRPPPTRCSLATARRFLGKVARA